METNLSGLSSAESGPTTTSPAPIDNPNPNPSLVLPQQPADADAPSEAGSAPFAPSSGFVGMAPAHHEPAGEVVPDPVIATYSTRGLEYFIMLISLGIAASSIASLMHSTVDQLFGAGENLFGTTVVSLSSAALVATLPIFAFLFLRLKKAELANPEVKGDASRKRAVQIMVVLTFLVGICNIIFYLFAIFNGGNSDESAYLATSGQGVGVWGNLVHLLITATVAGSIFAYYWYDEHRRG